MTMTQTTDTDLDDLPPSARYVLEVLDEADDPLPREAITEATYYSDSTVNDALRRLIDAGLVTATVPAEDLNRPVYERTI